MRSGELKLTISGDNRGLSGALSNSERGVRSFAQRAGGAFGRLRQSFGVMGKIAAPLAMIGGAAGLVQLTRQVVDYQDSLSTLGIRARLSGKEMMELSDRFHAVARNTGQSREAVVRAMNGIVSDVDTEFAIDSIEQIAIAATATSTSIEDTAKAFTIFRRDMGASTEEAAQLFNTMIAMDGSFSLDRLANATSLLGVNRENFESYNALLHSIKHNTGGIDGAARALESVGQALQNPEILAEFQRRFKEFGHESVFDQRGNIKDFEAFMNAMQDSRIPFTDTAQHFRREFAKAVEGFDKRTFDEFITSGRNATFVMDAFERKSGEAKFQINQIAEAGKEFATNTILPSVMSFTNALRGALSPEDWGRFAANLTDIASALGAATASLIRAFNAVSNFSGNQGANIAQNRRLAELRRELGEDVYREYLQKHNLLDNPWHEGFTNSNGLRERRVAFERDLQEHRTRQNTRRVEDSILNRREPITPLNVSREPYGQSFLSFLEDGARSPVTENNFTIINNIDAQGRTVTHIDGSNVTANVTSNVGRQR